MTTRFQKIALAAALVSGLSLGLPAFAQNSSDDAALAQQVKTALSQDRHLQDADDDIAVTASNGIVKITGWLTYADDIQTAEQVAKAVPGVKDVNTSVHVWSSNGRPGF